MGLHRDFNSDGKTDFIMGTNVWLSTGTGFVAVPVGASYTPPIVDWNRDGASDVLTSDGSGNLVAKSFGYVPEFMNSVSNELGATTTITYDRINRNGTLYTKGTGATYPTKDLDNGMYVVSKVRRSNGIGGTYDTNYAYTGAKMDLQGRGFLGFSKVTATELRDTHHYIVATANLPDGLSLYRHAVVEFEVYHDTVLAYSYNSSTTNNWGANNLGGTRNFVFLRRSVAASTDIDQSCSAYATVTTNYATYDAYGNPTQINVTVSDGRQDDRHDLPERRDQLVPRSSDQCSGQQRRRYIEPDAHDRVHLHDVLAHPETIEPTDTPHRLQTDYTLDTFGNQKTITLSGVGITTRSTQKGSMRQESSRPAPRTRSIR